ncbi:hypothetical protein THAOC_08132 [Thalassiosira oceanica]|uniref:RING-type domain-containing protein n=1 Tax=Thalassiosira oceanica TaxID=159749 RepID=K0SVQ8_THAOC|nr:hypothetical protein THAOC_08132 [Thalassiosira oceanica]|eukprot:EJK70503.1 hypothetical protein THAOC_08132 [Thalassiosira oceanica]
MDGLATKADYAQALRGYQNAVEEMRSPDRDEVERADWLPETREGDATGFFPRRRVAPRAAKDSRLEGHDPPQRVSSLAIPYSTPTMICGACERELPEDAYSAEQRGRRQSIRRCEECVDSGNQLVLMKKGSTRSEEDECPICSLPLPLDRKQSSSQVCCMKRMCNGCVLAAHQRGIRGCPFCRTKKPKKSQTSQTLAMVQKRFDAGDPAAIYLLANKYDRGKYGLEKDVARAVELYERAAELGVKEAHYNLGCTYYEGVDVKKDTAKAIRHYEAAAMRGHVAARYNLGCEEYNAGNYDLALQHWMISASLGDRDALNEVKEMFTSGLATKADYAGALRCYQSAVEEMKSPDRDEAEQYKRDRRSRAMDRSPDDGELDQYFVPGRERWPSRF